MKELSLRPYNGILFIAKSRKEYEKQHKKLFKTPDVVSCGTAGRFTGVEGVDGMWTYLIFADGKAINSKAIMTHELAHCVLHVFERCGIDPIGCGGEPFCYMLSQLMIDAYS